jgi:hypothetical protein
MLVDRHESALGRWEMAWSDPDPRLRAFVRRYAGYLEITPAPLRRRELPSGDVHFIISFGPPWDLPDPLAPDLRSERRGSFVAGLDDRHAFSEHDGFAHGAEVQFTPLGARAFFGLPMRELTHEVVRSMHLRGVPAIASSSGSPWRRRGRSASPCSTRRSPGAWPTRRFRRARSRGRGAAWCRPVGRWRWATLPPTWAGAASA